MASAPTLDLERLLAPLTGETPAGSDLRDINYPLFQQAKDLRTNAISAERKLRELAASSHGIAIAPGFIITGADETRPMGSETIVPWHGIADAIRGIP